MLIDDTTNYFANRSLLSSINGIYLYGNAKIRNTKNEPFMKSLKYSLKHIVYAIFIIAVSSITTTYAQEKTETAPANETVYNPTMHFKGFAHMYYSVGENSDGDIIHGASIRRLRFKPYGTITDKLGYALQFGLGKQKVAIIDGFMYYKFSPVAKLQVGQFCPPALRSGGFADSYFSTTTMNLVQRPSMAQNWASLANTTGYREVGVQVDGTLSDEKIYYGIMLANPKGNNLFTPSVKDQTNKHDDSGIKTWARIEGRFSKELAVGAFGGYSTYSNKNTSNEDSACTMVNSGLHVIYRSENFKFMTEGYIMNNTEDSVDYSAMGYFVEATYQINKIEPAIRYGMFDPNTDSFDKLGAESYSNLTIGLNYYFNKKCKIQANYIYRMEVMADGYDDEIYNNLFLVNLQYVFADK